MAIVKMQKISICANKKNRKAMLEFLQSMEAMEIRTETMEDPELERMDTQAVKSTFDKNAESLERAADVLKNAVPDRKGGASLFAEKSVVSRKEYDKIVSKHDRYIGHAMQVLRIEKDIAECKAAISRDRSTQEMLQPWLKLGIPMQSKGTRETTVLMGTMPGTLTEAQIESAASAGGQMLSGSEDEARRLPEVLPVSAEVLSVVNDVTYLTVLTRKRYAEQVEANLREQGFARPQQIVRGIPKDSVARLDLDITKQEEKIERLKKELAGFASEQGNFRMVSDYYRTRAEKYRMLGTIPQSRSAFFLEGWIPASKSQAISQVLRERFGAVVEVEEAAEGEEEPTLLKNNRFSENVEAVLESYGLPKQGKVDPTFIMSIFYVVFFGMMLSDAAYGIIMAVALFIVLKKHKRLEKGMKRMLTLFFWCGLSTAFWGFMYGGFFGDAIDVVAKTFFGYTGPTPILKPLWFEPMSDPMKLLMWCLLFGLIHLFTGLSIKGYELLKEGDRVGFVSDVLAWMLFLIGLIMLLLPSEIFASISHMEFHFSPALVLLSKVFTIVGALIILVMSGRDKKNRWVLRILLGAYDIYGVTSWLSDVLSYSRLLALGLATGVIANVINMLGSMGGGGVKGAIMFIVVFIVGHTANLAINLLGAYVHSNRLEFAEFFSKFYDAGGTAFKPFRTFNKYIEIKEEN